MVRPILRTPALHARVLEQQGRWREDLAAEPAHRPGRLSNRLSPSSRRALGGTHRET